MTQPNTPELEGARKPETLPLHPLVGNLWVPAWAIRPGAYEVLEGVTAEMPLWLLLHSRNADYFHPCYASREQLGKTIGVSRSTITKQLKALRDVGLLWELDRGMEPKSRQHRPPARWALDPFNAEMWYPKVEAVLARIAEEDGQNSRWLARARASLDTFNRRSCFLANEIGASMPLKPRRKKASKRPRRKTSRRPKTSHEGVFIPPQREGIPFRVERVKEDPERTAARTRKEPPKAEEATSEAA